jgi:hypothetical protein
VGAAATASPAFFGMWLIMMVTIIAYLVLVLYMFSYMKKQYHAQWVELGSPSFLNNSILNNFKFMGYFFNRRYLLLNDKKLNRLFVLIWALFIAAAILFVSSTITIFWR